VGISGRNALDGISSLAAPNLTSLPHFAQNRAYAGSSAPQFGQNICFGRAAAARFTGCPHREQNLAPRRKVAPQFGQVAVNLPSIVSAGSLKNFVKFPVFLLNLSTPYETTLNALATLIAHFQTQEDGRLRGPRNNCGKFLGYTTFRISTTATISTMTTTTPT